MSVMQRTIIVRPLPGSEADLFDRMSDDLKQSSAAWAGLNVKDDRLASWPWVDCEHAGKTIWAKAWSSEHEPRHRLLTVTLREHRDGSEWRSLVKYAALGPDEVVVFDTRDIRPLQAQLPVEQMPRLLEFLANYPCQDDDGLRANRPYVLNKKRVRPFLEFLESPPNVRRLPVVLISTTNTDRAHVADRHYLAKRLQGLAHIIALNPRARWRGEDLPLAHPCFDGAVRVYLPGYARQDPPNLHPWWHKDKFVTELVNQTNAEIVRFVIEKTHPRFRIHPTIPQLQRELDAHRQSSGMRRTVEQLRHSMEQSQNDLFDEFYADYERVQQERDEWEMLAKDLEDEVRSLRYRINQQWNEDDSDQATPAPMPRLLLSRQASELFDKLDPHEQERMRKTLLVKLLDNGLREKQSEIRQAEGGPCWVYPRGQAPNGQRAVYTLRGETVQVCALFPNHADYDAAWNRGLVLADYDEFVEPAFSLASDEV